MDLRPFVAICLFAASCTAVRLNKIFQLLNGGGNDSNLQGFLHVGNDYTVFLRAPSLNDKYLTYELYESQNMANSPESEHYKPKILAVSQIPVEFIKEQLRTFRDELHNATYQDDSLVPGTQVKTIREWQIQKALIMREQKGINPSLPSEPVILRTLNA